MEDEIKELKSVLRSLVVSSPTQVDVRSLMHDYRSMVGKPLPLAKYGYKDPVLFLKERFSDCFLFQGLTGNPVLTLIVPDTLKHIDKFVQKQKKSTTQKYKEKRRSIPAAVFPPPTNLICATFVKKERAASPPVAEEPKEVSRCDDDTTSTKQEPTKENGVQLSQNDLSSRSALENFMKKRMPLYNSLQREETENLHTDKDSSSKDDADSGTQTSSSTSRAKWTQLEELKTEIKNLIEDYPEGIWCTDLIGLYRERYGRELNFSRFGYTSVLSLACVLEDGLRIWRPRGSTDWKLLAHCGPPPPPRDPRVSPAPPYPLPPNARLVDPDDALPGIDFDPDVFPEDCMHYMESIPAAALGELQAGALLEVMVGEVYSPSHLWLIRLGDHYNIAMEDIMDEMTAYYTRGEGKERLLARGAVRVGHYCSSCYENDWHRSLIVKIIDSDTVKVRHVDYGTVERCAVSGLRPLLRKWGALPAQALRARLAGLRPPAAGRRWPRAAAAHLLRAVADARLVAAVLARAPHDDILEVLLIDTRTDEDICISTELIRSGHADPRPDSCLGTSECYLYPRFEALENGDTPNYAEINSYLRDGIALEFVEDYRRHVPPCLPAPPDSPPPSPPAPPRRPPNP